MELLLLLLHVQRWRMAVLLAILLRRLTSVLPIVLLLRGTSVVVVVVVVVLPGSTPFEIVATRRTVVAAIRHVICYMSAIRVLFERMERLIRSF